MTGRERGLKLELELELELVKDERIVAKVLIPLFLMAWRWVKVRLETEELGHLPTTGLGCERSQVLEYMHPKVPKHLAEPRPEERERTSEIQSLIHGPPQITSTTLQQEKKKQKTNCNKDAR